MTNLEVVVKECNFDPALIGVEILESLGYKVEVFADIYKTSIFVYDKADKDKLVFWNT